VRTGTNEPTEMMMMMMMMMMIVHNQFCLYAEWAILNASHQQSGTVIEKRNQKQSHTPM
jgi:hypothetical protein